MSGETKEVLGSNYVQNDVIINRLIDKMTLFDDNLMSLVFGQNIETTELLLRVIMERDIKVIDVRGQDELKNPVIGGRCITLDVHAIDVDGRHIDIEVQINAEGSHVRRARYHSSMMDARMLQEGQEFKKIKDSYVIFIYDHDKFRKGLPFYHIQRRVDETGEVFGDGSHIIYVNGRYEGNDDIGRMMKDFHQCRPEQIESETLSKAVAYYKEKEGRGAMSEAVRKYAMEYAKEYGEEQRREGMKAGIKAGIKTGIETGIETGIQTGRRTEIFLSVQDGDYSVNRGAEKLGMKPYYLYRQKNMSGNFENTGYARPGKYGLYNILIMEEKQTIVALGAGSITKRVFPDGRIERCDNVKDVGLYIEKIDEMIERKKELFAE